MSNYNYTKGIFTIYDYAKQKPISSFLPGIAGAKGTPIWCFYVNRGQGVASFGLGSKDDAIMEFSPFNTSLEKVPYIGFRTFIKVDGEFVEAFKEGKTRMDIGQSFFSIEEENVTYGYRIKVTYSSVPEQRYGALIRKVEITNISHKKIDLSVMDGITSILPFGTNNAMYKEMSNLLKSWMSVINKRDYLIFKMNASTADEGLTEEIESGVFMYSTSSKNNFNYIYDRKMIYGYDYSFFKPVGFIKDTIKVDNQIKENEIPSGFIKEEFSLEKDETYTLVSLYGSGQLNLLNVELFPKLDEVDNLIKRNEEIINEMTSKVEVTTSNERFDAYIKQCMLDNVLRGGYPCTRDNKTQYIYSRKHGDLERDYNKFNTKPMFYSYGEGNFRDVLQNRRNDVLFSHDAAKSNLNYFMSLIQLDGNNPLSVQGERFYIDDENILNKEKNEAVRKILKQGTTFGELYRLNVPENKIKKYIRISKKRYAASFNEGYWVDHFVYLLDLLEMYKNMYPEEMNDIYSMEVPYFQSEKIVKGYDECSILTPKGVRRTGSLESFKKSGDYLTINGEIYSSSIMSKLIFLVVSKLLNLDNKGYGLDMNASRPGWNDALNGLPNIYGSSVTDLIELERLIIFIKNELVNYKEDHIACLDVQKGMLDTLMKVLNEEETLYESLNNIRKTMYSKLVNNDLKCDAISKINAEKFITLALAKVSKGLEEVRKLHKGIYPTYIYYQVTKYQELDEKDGVKHVLPLEFKLKKLPFFLEGITKSMYVDKKNALKGYKYALKHMYDSSLGLFKVSDDISSCSLEIGRIRSFTKGWLERESCFLHMEYKFLLSLLSNGLYEEFFEAIKTGLVCNFDIEKYGRSPLENCSFIATSNHVDKEKHGQGFQPRLSGANAEMLSIYKEIFFGKGPFFISQDGKKEYFSLSPIMTKDMFKDNKVTCYLLGIKITYVGAKDTFKEKLNKEYTLIDENGNTVVTKKVTGKYVKDIKKGKIKEIIVNL